MAELKTKETDESVKSFIDAVPDETVRNDCYTIMEMMKDVTKEDAKMWGPSIVGFGKYHYKYESGHEGEMCIAGFSPRKQNISLYLYPSYKKYEDLLEKLGKYKTAKSCLYIKRLSDVDTKVLKTLISKSVSDFKKEQKQK